MGDRLREAVYINLGLLALKKCAVALRRGDEYIPFQDSKLTMLLSTALGGNSKTAVVICASQQRRHADETVRALRFGEVCGALENTADMQSAMVQSMIYAVEREIEKIESEIKQKERWEVREVRRNDPNAEHGTLEAAQGAQEIIKTGVIVGAEAERERLETLIKRRAILVGGKKGDEGLLTVAEMGFGGQKFGGRVTSMGGNAEGRFRGKDTQGLRMKGKKVAEWID